MQETGIADSSDVAPGDHSTFPLLEMIHSEAICSIRLPEDVDLNLSADHLAHQVFEHGHVEQYNDTFVEKVSRRTPEASNTRTVSHFFTAAFRELLTSFFDQECRLQEENYVVTKDDDSIAHFKVYMRGDITDDGISHVWVSFRDVTEIVDLKERIVTSLEQQQTQIGRELHDSIGQLLTSIRILSENLVGRLPPDFDAETRVAERILEFSTEASEELSQLERGLLIPEELSEEGLSRAVQKVANRTNSLPGISCVFVTDIHETVGDTNSRLHLYRIVQEAVNNAVRHGQPNKVEILLSSSTHELELVIADDGTGFNPDETDNHGLGLNSMKYRADVIGAELSIESDKNRGTTIRCVLAQPQKNS